MTNPQDEIRKALQASAAQLTAAKLYGAALQVWRQLQELCRAEGKGLTPREAYAIAEQAILLQRLGIPVAAEALLANLESQLAGQAEDSGRIAQAIEWARGQMDKIPV